MTSELQNFNEKVPEPQNPKSYKHKILARVQKRKIF